ncbi:MAG TPA: CheR family methyltransferase [Rhodanobacteraceae bacterium]|nr:CheR family methyltransferase [Rhodanobacteraceae bacterium]
MSSADVQTAGSARRSSAAPADALPAGHATASAPPGGDAIAWARDLEFDDRDFRRIRDLIYERAGIVLADHKRDMVYSRVGRRVRHYQLTCFADYLELLEGDPTSSEWEAFTNTLTTNLTSFFREAHHFPLLAKHVAGKRGPVRVWCAAASTGQEPYSIAMQLAETLGDAAQVEILATDIDTQALDVARRGIYPLKLIERLGDARRKRFFQRGSGHKVGYARIRPSLAARVRFEALNLVGGHWPEIGAFDAIFCRNVMIYFDTETQARILKRFAPHLQRDGLLFAGHSESFTYITDVFHLRGQTVYTLA